MCFWTENNKSKSIIIPPGSFDHNKKNILQNWTGFAIGELTLTYLGASVFKGKPNQSMFDPIKNSIVQKIEGWKARTLSIGGRLTLIKNVLNSVPIHMLVVLRPPKIVLDIIQTNMYGFLWGANKHQWVAQHWISKDINQGGLGVASLEQTMDALHYKITCK